jgi:2-polyprenyl-3-methyl-5-hydroxy-6-metoxy-1,4-benzoquinol methylase
VRDRDDIEVLRDSKTEVIVLSRSDQTLGPYYEKREEKCTQTVLGNEFSTPRLSDNIRRAEDFGSYVRNKHWVDFGCGLGGMLDELGSQAQWAAGLEPNQQRAEIVRSKGHNVIGSIEEVPEQSLDIITMFHVLEHISEPVDVLSALKSRLKPGGRLLVEVPHARDALFTLYDSDAFKKFTFWSEHLVLHTRQSLRLLLSQAGFSDLEITGYQRYPLANHLYWLSRGKPAGQEVWPFLDRSILHNEYSGALAAIDRTDTLISISRFEKD